jgi:hypothetical protein
VRHAGLLHMRWFSTMLFLLTVALGDEVSYKM